MSRLVEESNTRPNVYTTAMIITEADAELHAEIVRRIVDAIDPQGIILFGSRARGDHRPNSDLDLLIITDASQERARRTGHLYTLLADIPIEIDLSVWTPQEVQSWREVRQAFPTTAIREGVVLYARQG